MFNPQMFIILVGVSIAACYVFCWFCFLIPSKECMSLKTCNTFLSAHLFTFKGNLCMRVTESKHAVVCFHN